MSKNIYLVFDVESVGLQGEGFAVGFVVVDEEGNRLDCGMYSCRQEAARGTEESFKWVRTNCPKFTITHDSPWLVRAAFWRKWLEWKDRGAMLFAECAWPVEARFLAQCVDDHPLDREYQGPYPLHDVASVILAKGGDPMKKYERLPDELPSHNPMADAFQSARLLLEYLHGRGEKEVVV